MTNLPAIKLYMIEGEPRVLDTDLAKRLGLAQPANIRAVIEKNRAELEGFGSIHAACDMIEVGKGARREVRAFYLNEEQATLVVMFSRTSKAAEVRREIITVYTARRRGEIVGQEIEAQAPQANVPAALEASINAMAQAIAMLARSQQQNTEVILAALTRTKTIDHDPEEVVQPANHTGDRSPRVSTASTTSRFGHYATAFADI